MVRCPDGRAIARAGEALASLRASMSPATGSRRVRLGLECQPLPVSIVLAEGYADEEGQMLWLLASPFGRRAAGRSLRRCSGSCWRTPTWVTHHDAGPEPVFAARRPRFDHWAQKFCRSPGAAHLHACGQVSNGSRWDCGSRRRSGEVAQGPSRHTRRARRSSCC